MIFLLEKPKLTKIITLLQKDLDRYYMYKGERNAKKKEQSETKKEFSEIKKNIYDYKIKSLIEIIKYEVEKVF